MVTSKCIRSHAYLGVNWFGNHHQRRGKIATLSISVCLLISGCVMNKYNIHFMPLDDARDVNERLETEQNPYCAQCNCLQSFQYKQNQIHRHWNNQVRHPILLVNCNLAQVKATCSLLPAGVISRILWYGELTLLYYNLMLRSQDHRLNKVNCPFLFKSYSSCAFPVTTFMTGQY